MDLYRPGVSAKSAPPPGRHIDYMVFDDVEDGNETRPDLLTFIYDDFLDCLPPGRRFLWTTGPEEEVNDRKERVMEQLQDYAKQLAQQPTTWPTLGVGARVRPGGDSLLDRLTTFHLGASAGGVESLVELAAYGGSLEAEYMALDIPVPKWLKDNLRAVQARAKAAYRALQEEKIRRLEMEIDELRSKEEKKAAKEQELAELREALGITE